MKRNSSSCQAIRLASIGIAGAAISVGGFTLFAPSMLNVAPNPVDSAAYRENQTVPVIGELGGVPVLLPRAYANLVEYDGDPGWMDTRQGPQPKRTYQSKLASFGFEIRFPEMEVLTENNQASKRKEGIYGSKWLRVGVNSNSAYGATGDTALDAYIKYNIHVDEGSLKRQQRLPDRVFGLIGYTPINADTSRASGVAGRGSVDERNIYFHLNERGMADAYIECSNRQHAAAPCSLRFNLLPEMRAQVSVSFVVGLLPHWKEIQTAVRKVILGFRVIPDELAPQ